MNDTELKKTKAKRLELKSHITKTRYSCIAVLAFGLIITLAVRFPIAKFICLSVLVVPSKKLCELKESVEEFDRLTQKFYALQTKRDNLIISRAYEKPKTVVIEQPKQLTEEEEKSRMFMVLTELPEKEGKRRFIFLEPDWHFFDPNDDGKNTHIRHRVHYGNDTSFKEVAKKVVERKTDLACRLGMMDAEIIGTAGGAFLMYINPYYGGWHDPSRVVHINGEWKKI